MNMILSVCAALIKIDDNSCHGRNFVTKCGGTAWCETNIFIRSMQKWSFINTDSQTCLLEVFWKQR